MTIRPSLPSPEHPAALRPTFRPMETITTTAPTADPVAAERERVVRLFLDLAADLEEQRATFPQTPRIRDRARFDAYEDVAQEMRTLATELGVTP